LAPESALGFHPWIALSSAPAARSVSRIVIMSNKRTKKGIDFSSAFRHAQHLDSNRFFHPANQLDTQAATTFSKNRPGDAQE